EYQGLEHCPAALLHIETPLSSGKLGCSSAIQDCNGSAVLRPHEARGCVRARLARERLGGRVGLRLAGEEEEDLGGAAKGRQAQRHAVKEGLQTRVRRQHFFALAERRRVRKERRDVSVGADAEEQEVERGVVELALVVGGGGLLPELALDAVHAARLLPEPVE